MIAMLSFRPLASRLLLLFITVPSCSAAIGAWWTGMGPQIVRQNATTGSLMYSMCNSNFTPIFPTEPPLFLSIMYTPRNGTALTGVGWYTSGSNPTTWVR